MTQTRPVALVTGGSSGIGLALARVLAREGHDLVLVARREAELRTIAAELTTKYGAAVTVVVVDLSVPGAARLVADQIEAAGLEVEILVNNAGFARDSNLAEMPTEDWDAVIATHLRGTYLLTRAVLPSMQRRHFGRIVNISSISALGHGGRANYIAAKAGIEAFTKAVAHEVAGDGITVNAIGPGVIVTKMTELGARRAGRSLADHIEVLRQTVPVGRVGTPDDIARAVAFFVADDADFITGQVIYVSGGPHG
jgi:3-oxoacyl-[acyl-carrier protein] reductase